MNAIFNLNSNLKIAINSVNINDTMPLHTIELIKEEHPILEDLIVCVLGVSYLEELGDTRHSPSETLVRILNESWAIVKAHDPYVDYWAEMENIHVLSDRKTALSDADVVIFAVGHKEYRDYDPAEVVKLSGKKPLIIDCSNFLTDKKISQYLQSGCKVKGVGKGHIKLLSKKS